MAPKRARINNDVEGNLGRKQVEVTKFVDTGILARLNLERVTHQMFAKAGLGEFIGIGTGTHPQLTREFLGSLQVQYAEPSFVQNIKFTIGKKTYQVDLEGLQECFGITKQHVPDDSVTPDSCIPWWESVTGVAFDARNETDSKCQFPPWRIIHKVIAMCFLGKVETNKVSQKQLVRMYAFAFESNYVPCWASEFVKACSDARLLQAGDIAMGGMITRLCQYVDVPGRYLKKEDFLPGSVLYDENFWYAHSWLKDRSQTPTNGRLMYRYGPGYGYGVWYPRAEEVVLRPTREMYIAPDLVPGPNEMHMPPRRAARGRRGGSSRAGSSRAGTSGSASQFLDEEEDEAEEEEEYWRHHIQGDITSIRGEISDISERLTRVEVNQQTVLAHQQSMMDWRTQFDQRYEAGRAEQLAWHQQQVAFQEQQAREWEYARNHYYHHPPPGSDQ